MNQKILSLVESGKDAIIFERIEEEIRQDWVAYIDEDGSYHLELYGDCDAPMSKDDFSELLEKLTEGAKLIVK